jgi:hypothetical protein
MMTDARKMRDHKENEARDKIPPHRQISTKQKRNGQRGDMLSHMLPRVCISVHLSASNRPNASPGNVDECALFSNAICKSFAGDAYFLFR